LRNHRERTRRPPTRRRLPLATPRDQLSHGREFHQRPSSSAVEISGTGSEPQQRSLPTAHDLAPTNHAAEQANTNAQHLAAAKTDARLHADLPAWLQNQSQAAAPISSAGALCSARKYPPGPAPRTGAAPGLSRRAPSTVWARLVTPFAHAPQAIQSRR